MTEKINIIIVVKDGAVIGTAGSNGNINIRIIDLDNRRYADSKPDCQINDIEKYTSSTMGEEEL